MLIDQFPVGDRGFAVGHAIDDDPAGDPLVAARLASRVAPPTDSSTRSALAPSVSRRASAAMSVPRESMVGAQCPYHVVLAWRCRGDHRRAVVLGHLHRGLAGPAGSGVDQHGLPYGDAASG
jgi:hypothetical protein